MGQFDFAIACSSQRGARSANEDALRVGQHGLRRHAVLSDGAGGHARGAEASRHVVERVDAALRAPQAGFEPAVLGAALQQVHAELQAAQHGAEGHSRMHATVVVLWIDGQHDRALWSHIGDSRLYRLRYGAIDCVTTDDSVVQQMIDSGALSAEQAAHHPMKNRLLAAMGMDDAVEPHTRAPAEPLEDGDVFLLCSDGWWDGIAQAEMQATLRCSDTPQEWLDAMAASIEARGRPRQDNYSAIAVWVSDPTERTHPMDDAAWR